MFVARTTDDDFPRNLLNNDNDDDNNDVKKLCRPTVTLLMQTKCNEEQHKRK